MARGWHTQEPARFEGQELDAKKPLLQAHYSRSRIESPEGGTLNELGVRSEEDGTGVVLFECLASSLRYYLRIPKATRTERKKVKDQQAEGFDPSCPRCASPNRLVRTGEYLTCPWCGVRFGRPS